jgi:hypothetical protein
LGEDERINQLGESSHFWEEESVELDEKTVMLAVLATMVALPVTAQETVSAVAIDGYPDRALWVKEFSSFFIPEVDRRLAEAGNY